MVFFFTSTSTDPPTTLYMGRDKFENEDLIKYGYDQDLWFHVDKYSSAHVYLRSSVFSFESLPQELLEDCAQLVKANSIEGNKKNNIDVIYTPWTNLKKKQGMEVGEVSFHKPLLVKRIHVENRLNEIVNRLNKTKTEVKIDFREDRLARVRKEREEERSALARQRLEAARAKEEQERASSLRSYQDVFERAEKGRRGEPSKDTSPRRPGLGMDASRYEDEFFM